MPTDIGDFYFHFEGGSERSYFCRITKLGSYRLFVKDATTGDPYKFINDGVSCICDEENEKGTVFHFKTPQPGGYYEYANAITVNGEEVNVEFSSSSPDRKISFNSKPTTSDTFSFTYAV